MRSPGVTRPLPPASTGRARRENLGYLGWKIPPHSHPHGTQSLVLSLLLAIPFLSHALPPVEGLVESIPKIQPPQTHPRPPPTVDPANIVRRRTYADTRGRVTPYLVYLDHAHADIVLALRGLNLGRESDYALLLDNRLGKRRFDGGYVHNGLLRAAGWVLDKDCDLLRDLLDRYPDYTLTFTEHSLGAGVAAMLTMVVVLNLDKLGVVQMGRTRCYAVAPARCMSLNLAVRYADVINSVVLQIQ
ncbi:hypothetical protein ACQ4PT_056348 [Festuca glaucescens]